MTTYYVHGTIGDNGNDGLYPEPTGNPWEGPLKDLWDAVLKISAGDTIIMAYGTYVIGNFTVTNKNNYTIKCDNSIWGGSSSSRVTLLGYYEARWTLGGVGAGPFFTNIIFDASGMGDAYGYYTDQYAGSIFNNCDFLGSGNQPTIRIHRTSSAVFNNCNFIGRSNKHIIEFNESGTSSLSQNTFNKCKIYGGYQGVWCEDGIGVDARAKFNKFYNCMIFGNTIGIRLDYSSGFKFVNCSIAYNQIGLRFNNGAWWNGTDHHEVINSAVCLNSQYNFYIDASPSPLDSQYNNLYPSTKVGYYNGNPYTTLQDWYLATGNDANSISGDPKFVSTNDLHIEFGSANLDKGIDYYDFEVDSIFIPTEDFDSESRPAGEGYDIGCDEYYLGEESQQIPTVSPETLPLQKCGFNKRLTLTLDTENLLGPIEYKKDIWCNFFIHKNLNVSGESILDPERDLNLGDGKIFNYITNNGTDITNIASGLYGLWIDPSGIEFLNYRGAELIIGNDYQFESILFYLATGIENCRINFYYYNKTWKQFFPFKDYTENFSLTGFYKRILFKQFNGWVKYSLTLPYYIIKIKRMDNNGGIPRFKAIKKGFTIKFLSMNAINPLGVRFYYDRSEYPTQVLGASKLSVSGGLFSSINLIGNTNCELSLGI